MKLWEFKSYIDAFSLDENAEVEIKIENELFIPTEIIMDYGSEIKNGHKTLYLRGTKK